MEPTSEPAFVLGDLSNGLLFQLGEKDPSGDVVLLMRLVQPGLEADETVRFPTDYGPDLRQFARFVQDMARDWRGWTGERRFSTLEGELDITARHDGHVRLDVELRGRYPSRDWRVWTTITVEPGEQLAATGRDIAALL